MQPSVSRVPCFLMVVLATEQRILTVEKVFGAGTNLKFRGKQKKGKPGENFSSQTHKNAMLPIVALSESLVTWISYFRKRNTWH